MKPLYMYLSYTYIVLILYHIYITYPKKAFLDWYGKNYNDQSSTREKRTSLVFYRYHRRKIRKNDFRYLKFSIVYDIIVLE